jgi:hypothetical protein
MTSKNVKLFVNCGKKYDSEKKKFADFFLNKKINKSLSFTLLFF